MCMAVDGGGDLGWPETPVVQERSHNLPAVCRDDKPRCTAGGEWHPTGRQPSAAASRLILSQS